MSEKRSTQITEIKIVRGIWGNGEYKYNVQFLYNDQYCGFGKFVRTYEDALEYITKTIEEVSK